MTDEGAPRPPPEDGEHAVDGVAFLFARLRRLAEPREDDPKAETRWLLREALARIKARGGAVPAEKEGT